MSRNVSGKQPALASIATAADFAVPSAAMLLGLGSLGVVALDGVPGLASALGLYLLASGAVLAPLAVASRLQSIRGIGACPRCTRQLARKVSYECVDCGELAFSKVPAR